MTATAKKLFWSILALAGVAAVVRVVYSPATALPFILGLVLGTGVNMLRVKMLDQTVARALDMSEKNAGSYIQFSYLARYLLTGVVLVLAALAPSIDLWGAAIGILIWPAGVMTLKHLARAD